MNLTWIGNTIVIVAVIIAFGWPLFFGWLLRHKAKTIPDGEFPGEELNSD